MKKFIYGLALIFICLPTYAELGHYDVELENNTFSHISDLIKNSDCPPEKPLFPKIKIMEYPRLIDAYMNLHLKEKLKSLELLKMMEGYPEFKELSLCLSEKERCPRVDTVLEEAEKIKQENRAIASQNQKIEESTKKKNAEIEVYNNILTAEKNKFEKYQKILDKISDVPYFPRFAIIPFDGDILGIPNEGIYVKEETDLTLEEKWKLYLDRIEYIKNTNIAFRKHNESALKTNISTENKNKKIEVKNQKIQKKNDLLLRTLNMYFTPEYLNRLSKDYEFILEKHCISCDVPNTFPDMNKSDCDICPNREFIPDEPNEKYSRGKCKLKDKNGENIHVLGK